MTTATPFPPPLTVELLDSTFSDLTPIPQIEKSCVAQIDYSSDFIQAYNYFRAVVAAKETTTLRAFALTSLCVSLNPANYTVWHYRRQCWDALQQQSEQWLQDELTFTARLGGDNPKNYQIWYHRRALLERLLSKTTNSNATTTMTSWYNHELDYTANIMLHHDGKNYHAWCYRQWILKQKAAAAAESSKVWMEELEFCHQLITTDIRNNSAWNQRWLATHSLQSAKESKILAQEELQYALQHARLDPYNESPWRYYIAILQEQVKKRSPDNSSSLLQDAVSQIREMEQEELVNKEKPPSPHLLAALVDVLQLFPKQKERQYLQEAHDIVTNQLLVVDAIRTQYWKYRAERLSKQLVSLQ